MKIILTILMLLGSQAIYAAAIEVNSLGGDFVNDSECTLPEAIVASRLNGSIWGCSSGEGNSDDVIYFDLDHLGSGPHEITLEFGSFELTNSTSGPLIIEGPGMDQLTIKLAEPSSEDYYFQVNGGQTVWIRMLAFEGFSSSAVDVSEQYDFTLFDLYEADSATFEAVRFKHNTGILINFDSFSTGGLEILDSEFIENDSYDMIESDVWGYEDEFVTIRDSLFLKNIIRYGLIDVNNAHAHVPANFILTGSQFIEQDSATGYGARHLVKVNAMDADITRNYFYKNNLSSVNNVQWGLVAFMESSGIFAHNYLMENSGWADVRYSVFRNTNINFVDHVSIKSNTFYDSSDYAVFGSAPLNGNVSAVASLNYNVIHGSPMGCGADSVDSWVELDVLSGNRQSGGDSCVASPAFGNMDLMFMPPGYYGDAYYLAKPSHLSPLVDYYTSNSCHPDGDIYGQVGPNDGDADGTARCDIGAIEMPDSEMLTVGFSGDDAGNIHMSANANDGYEMTCEGPGDCLWPLPINQTFSLTANGTMGGVFQGWSGSDCQHSHSTCDITMDGTNESAYAEFEQIDIIFQNGFENP